MFSLASISTGHQHTYSLCLQACAGLWTYSHESAPYLAHLEYGHTQKGNTELVPHILPVLI